jgi:methionyl-tRNA synthetase
MVSRYRDGVIPNPGVFTEADEAIRVTERKATADADAAIERLAIHEALASIWTLVDELNGYITIQEPWALSKDPANAERLDTVLFTIVRGLGTLAVLLAPVMPDAAAKLWTAIGGAGVVTEQNVRVAYDWTGAPTVTALESSLFPRIEAERVE